MRFKLLKASDITLIELLNSALADEYLAANQYLAPIGLCEGKERPSVESEFENHYKDELDHAEKLKTRIIQLGGIPLMNPAEWFTHTRCGYTTPTNFDTKVLAEQNLQAEIKAIDVYNNLVAVCQEINDVVTLDVVKEILADEIEHKQDLEDFIKDMEK